MKQQIKQLQFNKEKKRLINNFVDTSSVIFLALNVKTMCFRYTK